MKQAGRRPLQAEHPEERLRQRAVVVGPFEGASDVAVEQVRPERLRARGPLEGDVVADGELPRFVDDVAHFLEEPRSEVSRAVLEFVVQHECIQRGDGHSCPYTGLKLAMASPVTTSPSGNRPRSS